MTTPLGFHVYTLPDGRRQKVRDDGRRGLVVGDEAVLWDALEVARLEADQLREERDELKRQAEAAHETRKARR